LRDKKGLKLIDKIDIDDQSKEKERRFGAQWLTKNKRKFEAKQQRQCSCPWLASTTYTNTRVESWMMKVTQTKGKLVYYWSARAITPKPHVVVPLKNLGWGKHWFTHDHRFSHHFNAPIPSIAFLQ
jgi:hypothetical protein